MRQRIVIAKIGGRAGTAVVEQFRLWSEQRREPDLAEKEPDQWPISCREEMEVFLTCLRSQAHVPPVVFFCEYVDTWSMGNLFSSCLGSCAQSLIEISFDRFHMAAYLLPDRGALAEWLRRHERSVDEECWFEINLLQAIKAWQALVDTAALVMVREVIGDTATDCEVSDSLARIPSWMAPSNAGRFSVLTKETQR